MRLGSAGYFDATPKFCSVASRPMTIRPSESVFIRFRSPMTTMFQSGTGPSGSVMQSLSACACRGAPLRAVAPVESATIVARTSVSATTARTDAQARTRQGERASS